MTNVLRHCDDLLQNRILPQNGAMPFKTVTAGNSVLNGTCIYKESNVVSTPNFGHTDLRKQSTPRSVWPGSAQFTIPPVHFRLINWNQKDLFMVWDQHVKGLRYLNIRAQIRKIITKTRLFKDIENFTSKNWKKIRYKFLIFFVFLLNEYPQSMFWAEIRKTMNTPVNPSFTIIKVEFKGSKLYRHVFMMGIDVQEEPEPKNIAYQCHQEEKQTNKDRQYTKYRPMKSKTTISLFPVLSVYIPGWYLAVCKNRLLCE